MKFLDDVIINAKSVASELSKKAGKAIDISKLKLGEAEIKADINKKFKELGKLTYRAKKEGADAEIAIENLMNEIEILYEALDAVNDEIVQLKSKVICPVCKGENPSDALFCNACGSSIMDEETQEAEENSEE